MAIELTLGELVTLVGLAVVLAVTDGAALSRLGMAWLSKKMGMKPREISRYETATDGDSDTE